MKGKLFIVSGPSGSGKSTVTKLVKDRLNIPLSISATTRQPRDGEKVEVTETLGSLKDNPNEIIETVEETAEVE